LTASCDPIRDFSRRNIIALEIEKVIASLTSRHFNRDTFLESLDRFYRAIELNAENSPRFAQEIEMSAAGRSPHNLTKQRYSRSAMYGDNSMWLHYQRSRKRAPFVCLFEGQCILKERPASED
jgi:hypothetical protein